MIGTFRLIETGFDAQFELSAHTELRVDDDVVARLDATQGDGPLIAFIVHAIGITIVASQNGGGITTLNEHKRLCWPAFRIRR